MNEENIKVVFSGRKEKLNDKMLNSMSYMQDLTHKNTKAVVNFCLNYGGRTEIVDACKKIAEEVINNKLIIEDINEEIIEKNLYTLLPPIDLLIRTSGEQRISNFMLWQLAYSEMYFIDKYFPDFKPEDLDKAIVEFSNRDRRFGANSNKHK